MSTTRIKADETGFAHGIIGTFEGEQCSRVSLVPAHIVGWIERPERGTTDVLLAGGHVVTVSFSNLPAGEQDEAFVEFGEELYAAVGTRSGEAGNVSAAYLLACLLALLPGTLVAFVLGALAGAASGVA